MPKEGCLNRSKDKTSVSLFELLKLDQTPIKSVDLRGGEQTVHATTKTICNRLASLEAACTSSPNLQRTERVVSLCSFVKRKTSFSLLPLSDSPHSEVGRESVDHLGPNDSPHRDASTNKFFFRKHCYVV